MVGTSPFAAAATTTIPNEIIPLNITFSNGQNFNAASDISVITASPLYTSESFGTVGTTQFGDAVMRSEFWKNVAGTNYHVLLASPTIEPTVSVTIPAADGYTSTTSGATTGYIEFNYFMNVVETEIIQQLKIQPTTMSLFATTGVKLLEPYHNYCCFLGYHNALSITTSSASGIFTTVWGPLTSANSVDVLSHEVSEWLNDPFYTNVVPSWVQPGETACGGGDLEVGDPVTNYSFVVNGYTLQDIVGYSWFSRLVPSTGIDPLTGKPSYDLLGKLRGPATNCGSSSPFGRVRVDPDSLKFDHVGLAFEKKVHVSQRNFDDKFSHNGTCSETKTASLQRTDDGKGKGSYEVIPRRAGRCHVTFEGGSGKHAELDIVIAP